MRSSILVLVLAGLVRYGSAACANDCSGNGRCNAHSACECYRNWMSNDCSQRVCFFGRAFVDTPAGDLNSDGKVGAMSEVMAMTGNTPSHELFDESYAQGDLEVGSFNEAHFYAECSGKGSCQRESGLCDCFAGYEGEGCTRVSCPTATGETCSGHGVCLRLVDVDSKQPTWTYNSWDSHKTQQCNCDPLYTGIACDQRSCPSGDDPVTKYEHVTMLCGSWGLKSRVKSGIADSPVLVVDAETIGLDPSQQINEALKGYENMNVYGTVSGASAKLSFFCGVKSTDVNPRKLSTTIELAAEATCNKVVDKAACKDANSCAWQAAVTQVTPAHNKEYCITVQGVNGLFTKSDAIVLGDSTYLLNATTRIAYDYKEELKQVNEVQTIILKGSDCDRVACSWNQMTGKCTPGAALLGFESAAIATCAAASSDSTSPFLTDTVKACVQGDATCPFCTTIKYNSGNNCAIRNPFALTFKNEYGSSFTTRTIECANYDLEYPRAALNAPAPSPGAAVNPQDDLAGRAQLAERMATADHCRQLIESALEALPNSALADIDVRDQRAGMFKPDAANKLIWIESGKKKDDGADFHFGQHSGTHAIAALQSLDILADHYLDVSFISNTGDVNIITVVGQETENAAGIIHHSDSYTNPDVIIVEKSKGTTDNTVCSNRGTCDYSTGTCKCFQGFTRQDCSLQNVLAMY